MSYSFLIIRTDASLKNPQQSAIARNARVTLNPVINGVPNLLPPLHTPAELLTKVASSKNRIVLPKTNHKGNTEAITALHSHSIKSADPKSGRIRLIQSDALSPVRRPWGFGRMDSNTVGRCQNFRGSDFDCAYSLGYVPARRESMKLLCPRTEARQSVRGPKCAKREVRVRLPNYTTHAPMPPKEDF